LLVNSVLIVYSKTLVTFDHLESWPIGKLLPRGIGEIFLFNFSNDPIYGGARETGLIYNVNDFKPILVHKMNQLSLLSALGRATANSSTGFGSRETFFSTF
jgi:hypothetical protein